MSADTPLAAVPLGIIYESDEILLCDALVRVLELGASGLEVDEEHLVVIALGVLLDGLVDTVNDIRAKNVLERRLDAFDRAGRAGVANE